MDLLGEAAHTLCQQVEVYVYQGKPTGRLMPLSLKQLAAKHSVQALHGQQAARWLRAKEVMGSYSTPVDDLIQADKYLRSMRSGAVNFSWQQRNDTSLEMLNQWAAVHVDNPHALLPVRGLIKVLGNFSSSNKPLCPDKTLSQL